MKFILQPWQLMLIILASWVNRQQQEVMECRRDVGGCDNGKRELRPLIFAALDIRETECHLSCPHDSTRSVNASRGGRACWKATLRTVDGTHWQTDRSARIRIGRRLRLPFRTPGLHSGVLRELDAVGGRLGNAAEGVRSIQGKCFGASSPIHPPPGSGLRLTGTRPHVAQSWRWCAG